MQTAPFRRISDQPMMVGESPLWSVTEQALYWIDINGKRLHRWDGQQCIDWPLPTEPGCIALHRDGGLIVALRDGIARFDPASGELEKLAEAPYDATRFRFNDGRCDPMGRFWMGTLVDARDHAGASLFCLDKGQLRDMMRPVTVSNGVAFDHDGRAMFHCDTTSHTIFRYELEPVTGAILSSRSFAEFSRTKDEHYVGRPDGASIDAEGNYWIAMMEGSRVQCWSPEGQMLRELMLPLRRPTMVTFGGPDLKTLFVTSLSVNCDANERSAYPLSGHVLAIDLDVAGMPETPYCPN